MQETFPRNILQRSCTLPEIQSLDGDDEIMSKENLLLKTHFFCKIGLGAKSMQSMTQENKKKITEYIHEKSTNHEDICEVPTSNGSSNNFPENSTSDRLGSSRDSEEFVKKNLIKQNLLLKKPVYARSEGYQSLTNLASQAKTRSESINEPTSLENLQSGEGDAAICQSSSSDSMDFLMKTGEQMRNSYYNRLIQMKILRLTPAKKNQSIIILDWDDTLLCTSYLITLGIKSMTPTIKCILKPLDEVASQLLKKASSCGNTFIITNAEEGWVQHSAQVFLPKTFAAIEENDITIISARSCYEKIYPEEKQRWKQEAFLSLLEQYEREIVTNLVCIGDSSVEIDAAYHFAKQFDKALVKTIKFKELPKPEELLKQQKLMLDKFDQIFVGLRDMAIRLEKKCH
jgi:hypothetical protein